MITWDWAYFRFLVDLGWRDNAWLLTAILSAACVLALTKNYALDRTPFQARHLLALVPLVFPALLLTWGVLFEHTTSPVPDVPQWQLLVPNALLLVQLLVNVACLYAFAGVRLSVFTIALFQAYWTQFAWLLAYMSIRNEWL